MKAATTATTATRPRRMVFLSSGLGGSFNLSRMNREIRPEPSPEELEAIEEALARLTVPAVDPSSAWWRAGIAEDLSEEEEPA
jgi:hypothetical protein